MWHQAGARAMHRKLCAQGRTSGDEGRAKIQANRAAQKRDREEGKGWRIEHTNLDGI